MTGFSRRFMSMERHLRALYICNAVSLIGGMLYGLYYGIFLYRETFSLSVLATDGLLTGLGAWVGYIIGIYALKRFGYTATFKTSFFLMSLVALLTAWLSGSITDWFMLLALLKGIPGGMFTASADTIMVREFKTARRNGFLQMKLAIDFIMGVILPIVIGAMISHSGGYRSSFLLAAALYAVAVFIPLRLPKPQLSFSPREVMHVFKRKYYKRHATNRTLAAGFNQVNGFVGMIIPFLMLKDELSVGLLTSAIALVAAGVSIVMRRIRPGQRLRVGYAAYFMRSITSLLFVMIWTAPFMIIWQLVNKLVTPLHDPLQQGLDIHNDSLIMGKELQSKALHINVLNNTLLFLGSSFAYGSFLFISQAAANQQSYVLQMLILGFALWRFINLTASAWINKRILIYHRQVQQQPAESYS